MRNYFHLEAVFTVLLAGGAVAVTFWSPTGPLARLMIVLAFIVSAAVGVLVQRKKESAEQSAMDAAQVELLNWQRGDYANPPYVGSKVERDNGNRIVQFEFQNAGNFPVYDIGLRLWDYDQSHVEPQSFLEINRATIFDGIISSIAPHTAQNIGQVELGEDVREKRFAARFTTRTGSFYQIMNAKQVGSRWTFATSVTSENADSDNRPVVLQIDPDYPSSTGDLDWRPSSSIISNHHETSHI
jgi:hypothetical protein